MLRLRRHIPLRPVAPPIVIVAEFKTPKPESKARGLSLFTSTFRTSSPDVFDLHLNSHSRLNLIQALIQAIHAGADEALMLDPRGFVASCNSTNFFVVRSGELWTSTGAYSFKGITQANVIDAWTAAPMSNCAQLSPASSEQRWSQRVAISRRAVRRRPT